MNADKLNKLADYLETVPRGRFDMGLWSKPGIGCGFAGCAMGWAVHGQLFPELSWGWPLATHLTPVVTDPKTGRERAGFDAAAKLFGIDRTLSEALFGPITGITPKQEAKRIRAFVCGGRAALDRVDAKRREGRERRQYKRRREAAA